MKGILFACAVLATLATTTLDTPFAWTGEADAIQPLCHYREQAAKWTGWWDLDNCGGSCLYELPSVCIPV